MCCCPEGSRANFAFKWGLSASLHLYFKFKAKKKKIQSFNRQRPWFSFYVFTGSACIRVHSCSSMLVVRNYGGDCGTDGKVMELLSWLLVQSLAPHVDMFALEQDPEPQGPDRNKKKVNVSPRVPQEAQPVCPCDKKKKKKKGKKSKSRGQMLQTRIKWNCIWNNTEFLLAPESQVAGYPPCIPPDPNGLKAPFRHSMSSLNGWCIAGVQGCTQPFRGWLVYRSESMLCQDS